jgi:hypothetical protein
MKTKLLLFILSFFGIVSITAQNLLKNGGFDADYVPFTYNGQEYNCPEYIEGWDKSATYLDGKFIEGNFNNDGLSMWNLRAEIREIDYSEDWMTDDNLFFLHLERFEDNGWYDGGVYQTIEIEAGKKYDLSFYYKANEGTVADGCQAAKFYVRIFEYGDNLATNETIEKGAKLKEFILDPQVDWTKYEVNNIDLEDFEKIVIFIGINPSLCGEKARANKNVYFQIDEVVFMESGAAQMSQVLGSKININRTESNFEISGLKDGAIVSIYDIKGSKIFEKKSHTTKMDFPVENLKGVFVVKVEDAVFKVIL